MKKRIILAGLLAVAALSWGTAASAQLAVTPSDAIPAPSVREFQGVRYMTGGVTEDERAQLGGIAKDFNLKLIFAEKSGDYLSNVAVVVSAGGGRKVLELTSEGPLVLAKLPPGEYRIAATAYGRQQTLSANVPAKGQRSLDFYW